MLTLFQSQEPSSKCCYSVRISFPLWTLRDMRYYFISTSSKLKDSKLKGKQDASLDSRLDHLALL